MSGRGEVGEPWTILHNVWWQGQHPVHQVPAACVAERALSALPTTSQGVHLSDYKVCRWEMNSRDGWVSKQKKSDFPATSLWNQSVQESSRQVKTWWSSYLSLGLGVEWGWIFKPFLWCFKFSKIHASGVHFCIQFRYLRGNTLSHSVVINHQEAVLRGYL